MFFSVFLCIANKCRSLLCGTDFDFSKKQTTKTDINQNIFSRDKLSCSSLSHRSLGEMPFRMSAVMLIDYETFKSEDSYTKLSPMFWEECYYFSLYLLVKFFETCFDCSLQLFNI